MVCFVFCNEEAVSCKQITALTRPLKLLATSLGAKVDVGTFPPNNIVNNIKMTPITTISNIKLVI